MFVAEDGNGRIVGTVQMIVAQPENQPCRADVAKLLVHRQARRRGIAQRLLNAIDTVARQEGKSVLVLDTVTGSDAERVYERAGWHNVGVIPCYAMTPQGQLSGTTFFYKHL